MIISPPFPSLLSPGFPLCSPGWLGSHYVDLCLCLLGSAFFYFPALKESSLDSLFFPCPPCPWEMSLLDFSRRIKGAKDRSLVMEAASSKDNVRLPGEKVIKPSNCELVPGNILQEWKGKQPQRRG